MIQGVVCDFKEYPCLNEFVSPVKIAERKIIGREDIKKAIMASLNRPELCNVVLLGNAGSGKSFINKTLIPIADERIFVHISDIKVGDYVFDENGKPVKVIGVYPQPEKLRGNLVIFEDDSSEICSDDHLWAVRTKQERDNDLSYNVLTTKEIRDNGVVVNGDNLSYFNYSVPLNGAVDRDKLDISEDFNKSVNGSIKQRYDILLSVLNKYDLTIDVDSDSVTFEVGFFDTLQWFSNICNSLGIRIYATEFKYGFKCVIDLNSKINDTLLRLLHGEVFNSNYYKSGEFLSKTGGDLLIKDIVHLDEYYDMTCIKVDSPQGLFLVGKNYIVTHNTAIVQSCNVSDMERMYLEVDLAKMVSTCEGDANALASKIKSLFDESSRYVKSTGQQLVLFIDEFHQIVQLSAVAVEALKPMLADSGTRGVRVIVATTYEEFDEYVSKNLPLVERLQRVNVPQADKELTVNILKQFAERYGVADQFYDDRIYNKIYDYTTRYIPASSQPRKSILLLDNLIGWSKTEGCSINDDLLAKVLYIQEGVNVAFKVDATKIKEKLDNRVYDQEFATSAIARRLQIAVADLHNKKRPMSSFIFLGSTGVGKTEICKALADILFNDNQALIRIDMTEYSSALSVDRFKEQVTSRVWAKPFCVLLFDEIEKAHENVIKMLLPLLDDARLTDRNNREVSFKNCYVVLTSNIGAGLFAEKHKYNSKDSTSVMMFEKLLKENLITMGTKFPPELVGRLDCFVGFDSLQPETYRKIAISKLDELVRECKDIHGVQVGYTKNTVERKSYDGKTSDIEFSVVDYVLDKDNNNDANASGGARGLVSTIDNDVKSAVAQFINENREKKRIAICVEGNLAQGDKTSIVSRAKIVIKSV